jgi:hypothetical protein
VLELFYIIADADCAAARRAVLDRGLKAQVDFRNTAYAEAAAALAAHGGQAVPALWDGQALHQGLAAIIAALDGRPAR